MVANNLFRGTNADALGWTTTGYEAVSSSGIAYRGDTQAILDNCRIDATKSGSIYYITLTATRKCHVFGQITASGSATQIIDSDYSSGAKILNNLMGYGILQIY